MRWMGDFLQQIETRKKLNFGARFVITLIIALTFLFLIWLLFYVELPQASRDLINIMVGAYVAVLAKSTDYWFKEKDDPEHKETEKHLENGSEEQNGYWEELFQYVWVGNFWCILQNRWRFFSIG